MLYFCGGLIEQKQTRLFFGSDFGLVELVEQENRPCSSWFKEHGLTEQENRPRISSVNLELAPCTRLFRTALLWYHYTGVVKMRLSSLLWSQRREKDEKVVYYNFIFLTKIEK